MTATYATLADLRARYPYRQITSASIPTDAQVQKWLDEAQAVLDANLKSLIGAPTPYTDPTAILILGPIILDYAIGRIREAYAEANGESAEGAPAEDPLVSGFKRQIADLRSDPSIVGATLGGGVDPPSTPSLRSYFSSGAAGDDAEFRPTFTRDRGDGNF